MKLFAPFLLLAASAQAHYRFSKLIVDGTTDAKEWVYIRETKSYQDDHRVIDVNSVDLRCFQTKGSAGTATIAAGGSLSFFYMARVPDGRRLVLWMGKGLNGQPTVRKTSPFPKERVVQIPKNLPSGDYLQAGGAQFYLSCAQVKVTNGGSGTPGPLVAFPVKRRCLYKVSDPGLILPVYPVPTSYTPPRPAVWEG
ncbi:hypothetical protein BDZ45DRAFT_792144 [Acephala macrosclerotiorum]|nr:hypothetical protein BDZ45DRAFT_792144 [Acephala macrosclerotiorum]